MRPIVIAALVLIATGLAPIENVLSSGTAAPSFLYTVTKGYKPLAWIDGSERFALGAAVFVKDDSGAHALVPDFAATADPAVSFDGKNVLLAGKKTARDKWQIWEIYLEGGEPKRITNCPEDCVRPFYLPEERIVYSEKTGGRFVIETVALAGGKPVRLTYGPGSALATDVLHDGRVLFEATFPLGENGLPELYTVYSDGSGIESYRCDHGQARHSGQQLSSGDIVFADQRGLARFTSALAKADPIPAPKGEYAGGFAETASGDWLVPWRSDAIKPFQLLWWKPGEKTLRSALQERGLDVVEPVLIAARTTPKRHPSALHDWPVANLLCLNAHTSKDKLAAASIQSVRLYTRDATGRPELLGSAPVEADGSFFVQVPGDVPLQFELLDGSGKTLKGEAGWFWVRRGEQRVCVGCHAGPESAPENAVPMTLLKSTTPADMTHAVGRSSAGGH